MPLEIAFRDKPDARLISETPPYPKLRASLATTRRRARSSKSGKMATNFRESALGCFMMKEYTDFRLELQP
jgi:hypothetical protein